MSDRKPTALRNDPLPFAHLVSVAAEQALLGALLISNRQWEAANEIVTEADFGYAVHGRIFKAIGMAVEHGEPANPVTLSMFFDRDEGVIERGGGKYLMGLAQSAVTISNASHYAAQIADLAQRRRLISVCQETLEDAALPTPAREATIVIEDHEKRLGGVSAAHMRGGFVWIGDAVNAAINATEQAYKRRGALAGVATGLRDLDTKLGGLLPGDLNILAGRPAMGKTAAVMQVVIAAAKVGIPSAVFSLEQSAQQLAARQLAAYADVPTDRQRRGDLGNKDWDRLIEASEWVKTLPVLIDETSGLTVSQIVQRARRAKRQRRIGLLAIDHLQLIAGSRRSESRRLEIEEATGTLKALAKELNIPILLLSQLSRAVEQRDNNRPNLADLRESGSIEQDADRVLMIYREDYYIGRDPPTQKAGEGDEKFAGRYADWEERLARARGAAEIIIAKDRHGSTDTVKVLWQAGRVRFEDKARG